MLILATKYHQRFKSIIPLIVLMPFNRDNTTLTPQACGTSRTAGPQYWSVAREALKRGVKCLHPWVNTHGTFKAEINIRAHYVRGNSY